LHQITDEIVRCLLGGGEVEHARLTHLALEGDFSALSVLDEEQINLITAKLETYDWKKEPDYSFREFLVETGLMSPSEVDSEEKLWQSVRSARPKINGITISDADQIFIWDWMILPNNLSIINFKGETFAIKWFDEEKVESMREDHGKLLKEKLEFDQKLFISENKRIL